MTEGSSFLDVKIDFAQSHLFFPHIIHWILAILFITIVITRGPRLIKRFYQSKNVLAQKVSGVDWLRLLGTIVLTIIYFTLMEPIGEYFPNTGLGFLLSSIPFMFLLSMLYAHTPGKKEIMTITASAILSPMLAWYLLAQVFNISLP